MNSRLGVAFQVCKSEKDLQNDDKNFILKWKKWSLIGQITEYMLSEPTGGTFISEKTFELNSGNSPAITINVHIILDGLYQKLKNFLK